ncbi:C-C motif chemokine 24 [Sorex araneus]|uniref:C-C motif chemokine 24 n=1 Tax=Sorex araneus TaxID=42254 RepID=UPI002433B6A4|nr:C-C motif chemokine 24 [Sorex araneus]
MAGPCSLAAGLLLLALCALHTVPAGSVRVPPSCCLTFISKKIPQNRVVGYQLASRSVCPKEGVIFTTRKGQKFCADPKLPWVQKYMKNLDARQKKAAARTRPVGTRVPARRRPAGRAVPAAWAQS